MYMNCNSPFLILSKHIPVQLLIYGYYWCMGIIDVWVLLICGYYWYMDIIDMDIYTWILIHRYWYTHIQLILIQIHVYNYYYYALIGSSFDQTLWIWSCDVMIRHYLRPPCNYPIPGLWMLDVMNIFCQMYFYCCSSVKQRKFVNTPSILALMNMFDG